MEWYYNVEQPPNLSKITLINISHKKLLKIPDWISNCNNLIELRCYDNKITQIPDTLPDSLRVFFCGRNQITQIPNTLPDYLQEFYCHYNKITQIPDVLPNSLKIFECHNNQITQIPNNLPNSLQEFDCSCNQITQIPNTLPNSLQEFDCSYNKITQIPLSIINLQKLTIIYNSNTNIYKPPLVKYFLDNVYDTKIKKHCYNLMWKIRMEY